jgi:hypothetical protein
MRLLSLSLACLGGLAACGSRPETIEDKTPASIVRLSPAPGTANASVREPIRATFSRPIDAASVDQSSVLLSGPGGQALTKLLELSPDGTQLTVKPLVTPTAPTALTVALTGAIRDRLGNPVSPPATPWSFALPTWLDLGGGLTLDPRFYADAPQIAFGPGDALWAAWIQGGEQPGPGGTVRSFQIVAASWSGTAWSPAGGHLNLDPTRGTSRPALCIEDGSGRPVVAWDEPSSAAARALYTRRWDGAAWQLLGGTMNDDAGRDVFHRMLTARPGARPVAAWEEALVAGGDHVFVKQWNGVTGWDAIGGGPATTDAEATSGPQLNGLALDGQGLPWIAFVLFDSLGTEVVHVKRFDGTAWVAAGTPQPGRGGWLASRDGTLTLGLARPVPCGMATCVELRTSDWNGADWAQSRLVATSGEFGDISQGALAIGPGGKLAVAYVQMETAGGTFSQTLRAATWTGGAWSPVGGALAGGEGISSSYAPTLAFDSAGVLHVAWGLYSATNLGEAHVFRENR